MSNLLEALKKILNTSAKQKPGANPAARRDPQFVGRSSTKEIEQATPERVGELVGHAPERVDT